MKVGAGDGNLRASDAERADAVRRLEAHKSLGHLQPSEFNARRKQIKDARTPNQIAIAFAELPELPARSRRTQARVSNHDRNQALAQLAQALSDGKLKSDEHAIAVQRVSSARTRDEIDAAFHGLPKATTVAARWKYSQAHARVSEATANVAREGGLRARKSFRRWTLSLGAAAIGVILLAAGLTAIGVLFLVFSVALFVSSSVALVRWWG